MSGTAATVKLGLLTKNYGGPPVLDEICLDIAAGESIAIMGRSGSGKSTLLKLIGALDVPDSGHVLHDGTDLAQLDDARRTRFRRESLGFVFQFFNLIPTLTVFENVALPLALNRADDSMIQAHVAGLLASLELDSVRDKYPDQLSGGEQQRIAIARAIVHRPGVIVADEPTGNLDDETAEHTLALLMAACRNTPATLIMATHSSEAAAYADRVLLLSNGHLTES